MVRKIIWWCEVRCKAYYINYLLYCYLPNIIGLQSSNTTSGWLKTKSYLLFVTGCGSNIQCKFLSIRALKWLKTHLNFKLTKLLKLVLGTCPDNMEIPHQSSQVTSKIAKMTKIIRKARYYFPHKCLLTFYNTMVYPYLLL